MLESYLNLIFIKKDGNLFIKINSNNFKIYLIVLICDWNNV